MTEQEAIERIERLKVRFGYVGKDLDSEALKMAIKALEKQIAKKPVETMICDTATWKCPCCGNELYSGQEYCDECGQAILDDWE